MGGNTKRPIEEQIAGDAFRKSLVARADSYHHDAPLWHGWALMDAFLAGIEWERRRALDERKKT